ncbi:hypothetical protein IWZ00DRAFT_71013 [Phyllosticta capitalensis]
MRAIASLLLSATTPLPVRVLRADRLSLTTHQLPGTISPHYDFDSEIGFADLVRLAALLDWDGLILPRRGKLTYKAYGAVVPDEVGWQRGRAVAVELVSISGRVGSGAFRPRCHLPRRGDSHFV